jgi:hypothetical protein
LKFTKPELKEFLTALASRKPELDGVLPDAKAFMTEYFFGSRFGQAAGANSVLILSDHRELTFRELDKRGQSIRDCGATPLAEPTDQPAESLRPLQMQADDAQSSSRRPLAIDEDLTAPTDTDDPAPDGMLSHFDDAWDTFSLGNHDSVMSGHDFN